MTTPPAPLRIKLLSERAVPPTRASGGAAGYDLASAVDCVVPAHGRCVVATDLAVAVPRGTYGRIAPRSGLAARNFIDTGAGVIDADYRGNVGVLLFNHSPEDFSVRRGDRVAQLVLECIVTPEVSVVPADEDLDGTARGTGGFGSTGA